MGQETGISWTDATWNPWQGCHKVSQGCKNCYMYSDKERYGQDPSTVVRSKDHTFNLPMRLKKPQRVFTCSWSDFFIKEADEWRGLAMNIIARTPHLTYQVLTKRPEHMLRWMRQWYTSYCGSISMQPLPNLWLGVSVESPSYLHRLNVLRETPAAVRFVSIEPLLENIGDITPWLRERRRGDILGGGQECLVDLPRLDWVIAGGESGHGARPCDVAWLRSIIHQCQDMDVACFVKQMGSYSTRIDTQDSIEGPMKKRIHWHDRKGADPNEWPMAWRIQQFPEASYARR